MTREDAISDLAAQIVQRYRPLRVILFGSHAYGSPRQDSDVDLLVVMAFDGSPVRTAAEILASIDPKFPVDLVLHRPQDVEVRYRQGDPLVRDAIDRGRVIYERAA